MFGRKLSVYSPVKHDRRTSISSPIFVNLPENGGARSIPNVFNYTPDSDVYVALAPPSAFTLHTADPTIITNR